MYLEYDDGSWNVKFYLTRYVPTQSDAIFGSFTVLISDSLFHDIKDLMTLFFCLSILSVCIDYIIRSSQA